MRRQLLMLIVPTQGQPTQSRLSGTSGTEGMPQLAFATATGCASGKKPVGKRRLHGIVEAGAGAVEVDVGDVRRLGLSAGQRRAYSGLGPAGFRLWRRDMVSVRPGSPPQPGDGLL